jgi:hypothetical protein
VQAWLALATFGNTAVPWYCFACIGTDDFLCIELNWQSVERHALTKPGLACEGRPLHWRSVQARLTLAKLGNTSVLWYCFACLGTNDFRRDLLELEKSNEARIGEAWLGM